MEVLKSKLRSKSTYSLQFWLLCTSSSFFFISFNMMIPELPSYIESLGGPEFKGYIIGLFTIAAGLSRPFSGKLTDKVGRIPVMVFGSLVCVVMGVLYPLVSTVWAFLLLRFVHGLSTGFKPTGTAAYIADIIPAERRGEAMGLLGVFGITAGLALGPLIGDFFVINYGVEAMFYASAVFAFLSVLVLFGMKETLPKRDRSHLKLSHLQLSWADIYEPKVLQPALVMVLMAYIYGLILTVIQDFSIHVGFEHKGAFFTAFSISALLIRIIAGKVSDKVGRKPVLFVVTFIAMLAMFILSIVGVGDYKIFYAGAFIFGLASGMYSPVLFAWAIDLSDPKHKGRAMSTVYIALEFGIMFGAFFSAAIFENHIENFKYVFYFGIFMPFLAMLYLAFLLKKEGKF